MQYAYLIHVSFIPFIQMLISVSPSRPNSCLQATSTAQNGQLNLSFKVGNVSTYGRIEMYVIEVSKEVQTGKLYF